MRFFLALYRNGYKFNKIIHFSNHFLELNSFILIIPLVRKCNIRKERK